MTTATSLPVCFLAVIGLLFSSAVHAQTTASEALEAPMNQPVTENMPAQEKQKAEDLRTGAPPNEYSSTMFYAEELKQVDAVIEAIKSQQPLPDEEDNQAVAEVVPQPTIGNYIFPQFYLTSIVYQNAQDWVIWVNHKKITTKNQEVIPGLRVDKVSRDHAAFTYNFIGDANINASSQTADPRIKINPNEQIVTFTLVPNQTFSAYSWQIYEGQVAPMQLVINNEQAPPDTNVPTTGLPSFEELLGEDDPAQKAPGIGGILQEYQQIEERF